MRSTYLVSSILVAVIAAGPAQAFAGDLTIFVAPRNSAAASVAAKKGSYEPRLFRALDRAAKHLVSCGACTVTIAVAGGAERGKGRVGQWTLPQIIAPKATLRILGGYDERFVSRRPFVHPTILTTGDRRSGPVFFVDGRRPALRSIVFSGFLIDVSAGNRYDAKTGALHKGASSSWPLIAFGRLATDHLVIRDNIFANAANAVGGPKVRALSNRTVVEIRNNFFVNNVHCWQVSGLPTGTPVARYVVEGNTFYRNFPYNPDPTTSNPGTVEIGARYTAKQVVIRGNLFAHNPGGAIFAQWDDTRGPPITIEDNLFFANGALFEAKDAGQGALVGKFNGGARHIAYTPEDIADEMSWTTKRNVVLDPNLVESPVDAPKPPEDDEESFEEDLDEDFDEDFGTVEVVHNEAIDTFAQRVALTPPNLPYPTKPGARRFGAHPSRVARD